MTTKKKIIIASISIVIIILLFLVFYFFKQRNNIIEHTTNENGITNPEISNETGSITGNINSEVINETLPNPRRNENFLTDDDISGLTGCSDPKYLEQFSGFKLVKKVSYDDEETYDINIYDMSLDIDSIIDKETKLKQMTETEKEKNKIDIFDKKIEEINNNIVHERDDGGEQIYSDLYYHISTGEVSGLEKLYRNIDRITFIKDQNFCLTTFGIENDPRDKVNRNMLDNANISLGNFIDGRGIDLDRIPSLRHQNKRSSEVSAKALITQKVYKIGKIIVESSPEAEGYGIHLLFLNNIGNKIYQIQSEPFGYLKSDSLVINWDKKNQEMALFPKELYKSGNGDYDNIIKTLDCNTQKECSQKLEQYATNLLNGTETLAKYKQAYEKLTRTIDKVFGE